MTKNILHIASCDKFIPPFIELVREDFDFSQHEFYLTHGMAENELKSHPNVTLGKPGKTNRIKEYLQLIRPMHQSKKIILHGLFNWHIVIMLFFMPWLLKKSYWVMWGGDLYVYQLGERNWKWKLKEFFRRPVIKKMEHLVTYIKGDYELAQQWYGATGRYHECFMYPSNLYKDYVVPEKQHTGINILVGNSADPSNNHSEVFDKLEAFKEQDIKIYAPLSYGNQVYAQRVIEEGKKRFGEKFQPLTEMMPFNQYLEFLGGIDIAIFNHKRQQAMGNAITLLGLGKKVYMRSDVTQWNFFKSHDIAVYDIEELQVNDTDQQGLTKNKETVKQYFCMDNYLKQLHELFD